MNASQSRGLLVALGLVASLVEARANVAQALEACYSFGGQEVGTAWPIETQTALPIDIGTIRVQRLKPDGVAQTPNVARLEVVETAIAGGRVPELAGTGVAIQLLPAAGVKSIRLRYAQRPEANDGRAVTVEVNGLHRDWRGGFETLHGEHPGRAGHPARFTVTPDGPTQGNGWQRGRLVVAMKNGSEIRSFTLGAAHLRIDDVCFGNGPAAD